MKKRMLALLMAFVMVLGMLPGVSLTAHAGGYTLQTLLDVVDEMDDDACVWIEDYSDFVCGTKADVYEKLESLQGEEVSVELDESWTYEVNGEMFWLFYSDDHEYDANDVCQCCHKGEVSYTLDDVDEDVANIDASECIYISGNGTKTATKTGVRMVLFTLTEVTDIAKTADGWTLKSGGVLYTIAHTESHSFENYVCTTCGTAVHGVVSNCTAHNDIHIGIYKVEASGLIYFDAFDGTSYYNSGTVGTSDFTIVGGQEPKPGMVLINGNSGFEVCSYATFKLLPQYCSHSEVKDEVCAACGKAFYSMLDTTESWVDTAETDASFRSSAPFDHFIRVEVDGNTIDGANYTVKEGSTIVTLKASFLKTLSVGKHTVSIVSGDGAQAEVKVTSEFTIKAGAPVPKTADPANNTLMLTLILGSALVLAMVALEDKKVRK